MIVEMFCLHCQEGFVLSDYPDAVEAVEHYEREDGTPCGSTWTRLAAVWRPNPEVSQVWPGEVVVTHD